jgi:hypothetical protein
VSNTTLPKRMLGRDVAEVAVPASALVSDVDVMQPIFAAPTDTMTGGRVRRLQELAQMPESSRACASDEGGSSVFVKLLFDRS